MLGGAVDRPHYAWCLYHGALLAKALGKKAITAIEFGVAGGNGLVCLCDYKRTVEKETGIEIRLVGFDAGSGLPSSSDPRDMLYSWPEGAFPMDQVALEKRIAGRAQLVIGNVGKTLEGWEPAPDAPIGAILFDLDYYSSTINALQVLTKENVLPRIWCYFDDVCTSPDEAATEILGERAAIAEFNSSARRKALNDNISLARAFRFTHPQSWHQHIYVYHRLSHPQYNSRIVGSREGNLALAGR
jgi:hypothetical protein